MSQGFTKDYLVKATGDSNQWVDLAYADTEALTSEDVEFTVPAGVKQFKLLFHYVTNPSASNDINITLGTAGGYVVTGYASSSSRLGTSAVVTSTSTTTFHINRTATGDDVSGVLEFVLLDAATNQWSMSGTLADRNGSTSWTSAGGVTLTDGLTSVKVACSANWGSTAESKIGLTYLNPELAVSGIESVAAGVTDVFINGTKQATTSGSSKEFTIPSGVKAFTLSAAGVSTTATAFYNVILGDAGGQETSGYLGQHGYYQNAAASFSAAVSTSAFQWAQGVAATEADWVMYFTLHDAATNTWSVSGTGGRRGSVQYFIQGSKSLSGELTTVSVEPTAGTFDAGSLNIQYENQELDLGSGVISGGVVQTVNYQDGEVATSTTAFPIDNTIPQSSEGSEMMTASITPNSTANKLRIDVVCNVAHSLAGAVVSAGLFQDSTANALAAGRVNTPDNHARGQIVFSHWMDAGTVSSTTFKVRVGGSTASTTTFNGTVGTREFGGVMASSITITEYKA